MIIRTIIAISALVTLGAGPAFAAQNERGAGLFDSASFSRANINRNYQPAGIDRMPTASIDRSTSPAKGAAEVDNCRYDTGRPDDFPQALLHHCK